MNKERSEFVYELSGIIKEKRLKKKHGRECFKLLTNLTNFPQTAFIQAFKDKLVNPNIWQALENNQFIDKKYLFFCHNYFGKYHLINWKELTSC